MTRPQFSAWLRCQKYRNDPVGDLARDFIADQNGIRTVAGLYDRLVEVGACDGAYQALEQAESEWLVSRR